MYFSFFRIPPITAIECVTLVLNNMYIFRLICEFFLFLKFQEFKEVGAWTSKIICYQLFRKNTC